MQIDFNSLSFKIQKPESDPTPSDNTLKQYMGFEETQTTNYEQQTANPFRRTFHLFKHVQVEKRCNEQKSCRGEIYSNIPSLAEVVNTTQTTYSLENFDSFKNCDSNQPCPKLVQPKVGSQFQCNQSQYIKIQSQCQHSDDFSLIIDDLNCEIKCDDLSWDHHRRIKTEHNEEPQHLHIRPSQTKHRSGIFCLTAQDESSESTVKQFYFNLKEEQAHLNPICPKDPIKNQLKTLLYDFIDDLQIMDENDIDPDFIDRVSNCLITIKKIPKLPIPTILHSAEKWGEPKRSKVGREFAGRCENDQQLAKVQREQGAKNKQNSMWTKNTTKQGVGNLKSQARAIQVKNSRQSKKKKWAV